MNYIFAMSCLKIAGVVSPSTYIIEHIFKLFLNFQIDNSLQYLGIFLTMDEAQLLTILKISVMVAFFAIVIVFGTLPIRSKNFKKRPLLRAIGATFAGCLFLNVAIMHILPEAADTLEDYLRGDDDPDKEVFPLAYLLLMVGFIITVFFTKVLSFHSHQQDHKEEQEQDGEKSEDTDSSPRKKRSKDEKDQEENINSSLLQKGSKNHKIRKSASSPVKRGGEKNTIQHHSYSHEDHQSEGYKHSPSQHSHDHVLKNKSMLNEAYILTLAIYFHTIFEGIAIGVQNSITGFLSIAVAIAFHKWADALSMGCHYKSKNIQKKLSYTLILGQAILNVLSIGLGWIISSSGDVVEAIFLSISAGTFLAISTIEILGQQLHHRQYMPIKFALLVGATGFVASIWFFENSIFNE